MARNGIDAARQIAVLQPDVAFLDIQMPGLSGLEVAQGIEGATRAVFVTAYDEYAVQAFEQAALDYLLKPFKADRLARSVRRIQASLGPSTNSAPRLRFVRAAHGAMTYQVAVADVMYFHSDDKYTVVRTASEEYVIRTSITELAAQLDPEQFWQVHRSTLVNLDHLAGTRRDDNSRLFLRMKGLDTELPVSRAYVHLFKAM
jgi:DNA-binding LytR/AlgR family response regulator